MAENKLVMVNKTKLREIRDEHRKIMKKTTADPTLLSAWVLLAAQGLAIEALLTEIVGE